MTAEVAAGRPPDPRPASASRADPVGPTPKRPSDEPTSSQRPGGTSRAAGSTLTSRRVAALPILGRFLRRLRLEEFLRDHLPSEDRRVRVPTATALLVLLQNLLISREPLYGGRRVGRPARPRTARPESGATARVERRPGRTLPRPPLRHQHPRPDAGRHG